MRIWSLHPKYLDRQGLLACWRETLLAQAVLLGKTKGYTNHPQLIRFKAHKDPIAAIGFYLDCLYQEALHRDYKFNKNLIESLPDQTARKKLRKSIRVTTGQLDYEWQHLMAKETGRSPQAVKKLHQTSKPEPHPLFALVEGGTEEWEKTEASQYIHRKSLN